jgi:hypothetical protein
MSEPGIYSLKYHDAAIFSRASEHHRWRPQILDRQATGLLLRKCRRER